ncbi:hypothetical protein [Streptomyces tendae]|uniref:hypothetical protein n=1 Tax=Streptomyces tendae TaxID=1932 RepID=UPI00371FC8B2
MIGSLHRRHRAEEFKKFLIKLGQEILALLDLHMMLDNYATHKAPAIKTCCWPTHASTCTSHPPDCPGSTWSSAGSPS